MRRATCAGMLLVAALLGSSSSASARSVRDVSGEITVAVASSLTESFEELAAAFERRHEGVKVRLNLGASSTLEAQVEAGAPVDVYASADMANMRKLVRADLVDGRAATFARNRLAIAVEPDNPEEIRSLADTVEPDVRLVLCAAAVPCGRYARDAYAKADVRVPEVPTGLTAKDTLAKVILGEADAAIVYATDAEAAGDDIAAVRIPSRDNVVVAYPIAVVAGSDREQTARAFVGFVRSDEGLAILRRFGFLEPR